MPRLSRRLLAVVDALPLRPGMRVLEVGCGPGAAAREVARRMSHGHVLGIDRSDRAIAQAVAASAQEMAAGILSFRRVAIEDFRLDPDEAPFQLAFAARVGALDGRHPELEASALERLRTALLPGGGCSSMEAIPCGRSFCSDRRSAAAPTSGDQPAETSAQTVLPEPDGSTPQASASTSTSIMPRPPVASMSCSCGRGTLVWASVTMTRT